MRVRKSFALILAALLWASSADLKAQSLHLRAANSSGHAITAQVGDTLAIDIRADFSNLSISGAQLYLGIPAGPFEIVAASVSSQDEIRPFSQGPLLNGAMEFSNQLMPSDQIPDLFNHLHLLSYAAVLGPGKNRGRSGSGIMATFHLRCTQAAAATQIHIAGNPYYETFLVLDDGYGERLFQSTQGLEITVQSPDQFTPDAPAKPAEPSRTWGQVKTAFYQR
jgi:hypothetical protein